MEKSPLIDVMREAEAEIKSLRATIDRIRPDAIAYRAILTILRAVPEEQQGASVDTAWRLRQAVEALTAEED